MQCSKCHSTVSDGTTKCPNCGHEPKRAGAYMRGFLFILGIGLCLTGLGAVIGLPLIAFATYAQRNAESKTVASPA